MSSALLDTTLGTGPDSADEAAARLSAGEALRQQTAERLAAHRRRRAGQIPSREAVEQAESSGSARAAQIAAAVAERYSKSQSYRAFLAEEAERAVQQARAAAEMAAIKAKAMEAAQQSLLDALEKQDSMETAESVCAALIPEAEELELRSDAPGQAKFERQARRTQRAHAAGQQTAKTQAPSQAATPSFAIRLADEVALQPFARETLRENRRVEHEAAEMLALDEEIELLHGPALKEFIAASEPLPANLIEFPRQLVASRKARPRLAEGPLREDAVVPGESQLRIFEVDTAQISTEPAVQEPPAQWTSIVLDTPQRAATVSQAVPARLAGMASIARRARAAVINACVIGGAFAAFAGTAAVASGNGDALRTFSAATVRGILVNRHAPDYGLLPVAALVVAGFLYLGYQWLFFTFSDSTPGMRYARIGLCTFGDENPSRRAMRRRVLAVLLSALPLGLGFAWTVLDEEKLSWHDRVCRMYLREY